MYVKTAQALFSLVVFAALISAFVVFLQQRRYCQVAFKAGRFLYVLLGMVGLLAVIYSLVLLPKAVGSGTGIWLQAIEVMVLFAPGLFYCYKRGKTALKWGRPRYKNESFPWFAVSGFSVAVFVYSLLIFSLMGPGQNIEHWHRLDESGLMSHMGYPLLMLILIAAAIGEEVIFRLYMQNRLGYELSRWGLNPRLAIVIVAFIWALGHAGILVPDGIKEWQIFGVGLVLGWVMETRGLEACIFIHMFLNITGWLLPVILRPLI